jgi:hypothetical protein
MKRILASSLIVLIVVSAHAQIQRYSTAWFGPNAFPVPELTDALIPASTTFDITADYYFGFGDQTKNGYFRIEIPLLSEKIAFKLWSGFLENYELTPELAAIRGVESDKRTGKANSDIYVQTRILLKKETGLWPSIILNSTLKTTSGTENFAKRYYNTSGYYFDIEAGKSFRVNSAISDYVRLAGTLGFLCWETDNFTQNEGPMYGFKLKTGKNKFNYEIGLRGYSGWMSSHSAYGSNYGDKPVAGFTKLTFLTQHLNYYIQYQQGFRDYPYHQVRMGIQFSSKKLTPNYK